MILRRGIDGPDVLNLELVLQGLGFDGFDVNGVFDEKTENVIKYIQKAHPDKAGEADGIVGDKNSRPARRALPTARCKLCP